MKINIISQNGHRLNEHTADILRNILEGSYEVTRVFTEDSNLILMTSGTGFTVEAARAYESGKKIIFFHEEITSTIVPVKNIVVVSQFKGLGDIYFPISKLYIFSELFKKNNSLKFYDFVYWGHQRDDREFYGDLPDNNKSLYIGEWDYLKPNSHHCNYIRDPEVLHTLIGTGKRTIVDGSSFGFGVNNLPLRVYEALGAGVIPDRMSHKWDSYEEAFKFYVGDTLEEAKDELEFDLLQIIKENK